MLASPVVPKSGLQSVIPEEAASRRCGVFRLPPGRGDRAETRGVREELAFEICDGMIDLLAAIFNVSGRELRSPGRCGKPVARVRQVGMYVAHVTLGLTMTQVGRGFGRDRSTVLHACHLVEDMRDETEFDRIVGTVERIAEAAFSRYGITGR
jgi:hypothetical protein